MACWPCSLVPLPGRPCPWKGEGGRNSPKCVPKNSFLGVEISSPRYIAAKDVLFSKTTVSVKREKLDSSLASLPSIWTPALSPTVLITQARKVEGIFSSSVQWSGIYYLDVLILTDTDLAQAVFVFHMFTLASYLISYSNLLHTETGVAFKRY